MSWEHILARQLKDRDNPTVPRYLEGEVVSATPLKIAIYDGSALLEGEALRRVDPLVWAGQEGSPFPLKPLEVGQKVLLLGEQSFVILGVLA